MASVQFPATRPRSRSCERPPSAPRPRIAAAAALGLRASPRRRPHAVPLRRSRRPDPQRAGAKAGVRRPSNPPRNCRRAIDTRRSDSYYETKGTIFGALIEAIDLGQLAKLDADSAREEIRDIVNEIIAIKNIVMSISEQEDLLDDICNDVLGYGPLEPLLARDEIADIMVNGSGTVYIEVGGKIQKTGIRFRDNQQLLNICQRIVSQVGRRVDESSPICDARLPDGSRVNAIVPPLAIDGPALTIRKFSKDKLTLEQLVRYGSISPEGAEILKVIGRCRVNVLISGGTGSGKTTLLNCLTRYIDDDERIVTCEDAAELQLQQPHVVRLETRPPNLEGEGQITMRDLVRNCLRMRPERIIVGEVRGPEAFDLLQAMNTGHDGSMGTLHANTPREALSRLESMITMGGYALPSRTIREMIVGSIDVIIQAARLRDGSRRITHITEVMGMEGDVIITQDLFLYDIIGEDANGNLIGRHKSTGIGRPKFWDRARYYGEEKRLAAALDAATGGRCGQEADGGNDMNIYTSFSLWWRSRSAASPGSSFIRSCPASGTPNGAWPASRGTEPAAQRPARGRAEVAARAGRRHAQAARSAAEDGKRVPLSVRLAQAGLSWSTRRFLMTAGALGLVVFRRRDSAVGAGLLAGLAPGFRGRRRPCRSGFCRFSRSGGSRTFSTVSRTPSTSSCAASRPDCRCSTALS